MLKTKEVSGLAEQLAKLRAANGAQNGIIYPPDSLHAKGFYSPSCEYCRQIALLEYMIGQRDCPSFLAGELEQLREKAENIEAHYTRLNFTEATINHW